MVTQDSTGGLGKWFLRGKVRSGNYNEAEQSRSSLFDDWPVIQADLSRWKRSVRAVAQDLRPSIVAGMLYGRGTANTRCGWATTLTPHDVRR
jgi:hypothetical protein